MILFANIYMATFYKIKVQTVKEWISIELTSAGEESLYKFLTMYCEYKHFPFSELLPFSDIYQNWHSLFATSLLLFPIFYTFF